MIGIHRFFHGGSRQKQARAEAEVRRSQSSFPGRGEWWGLLFRRLGIFDLGDWVLGIFAVGLVFLPVGCAQLEISESRATLDPDSIDGSTPVWDLLIGLGEEPPEHRLSVRSPEWVNAGRELVFTGSSVNPESGVSGNRLSKFYRCTDCHSTKPEQRSLLQIGDPDAKLSYAVENDLSLFSGSSFVGLVNHESWYNGDYAEKYRFSPSIRAARARLTKAIDFCSRECSKGRDPEPWERDAILAYLWSLEWRLGDLGYADADLAELRRRARIPEERKAIVREIQGRYRQANPATFGEVPLDPKAGYPIGRAAHLRSGREVWARSCLHCHGEGGSAQIFAEGDPMTWKSLDARFDILIYRYIREGTHHGKEMRPYMPNFTREKLSDGQIEDLKAYIRSRSRSAESS